MENKKYYKNQIRDIEAKEEDKKMVVYGKAIVYDTPTVLFSVDGEEYKEIIKKDAFKGANLKNAFFKYNHNDQNIPLARYKNGGVKFIEKEDGVYIEAVFSDTSFARDLYTLIKDQVLDRMSFAFTIKEEEYNEEEKTFYIKKIEAIYDISAVNVPAYDDTFIYAQRTQEVDALRAEKLESLKRAKVDALLYKKAEIREKIEKVKKL